VLTLGVSCCMFTSMIMLPAMLTWITRNRKNVLPETVAVEPETAPVLIEPVRRAA
jgi:hypothetical protein